LIYLYAGKAQQFVDSEDDVASEAQSHYSSTSDVTSFTEDGESGSTSYLFFMFPCAFLASYSNFTVILLLMPISSSTLEEF